MNIDDIRHALEKSGKSKKGLAEALGRSPQVVTEILKGNRELKAKDISIIANYLEIDLGHSSPIGTSAEYNSQEGAPDDGLIHIPKNGIIELDTHAGLGGGGELSVAYQRNGDKIEMTDAIKPEPWILPAAIVRERMRATEKNVIAVSTQGDSMSPTIEHGDVVFVDTRHKIPSPPGLYAIRDRYEQIIVKRLDPPSTKTGNKLKIVSDNPKHQTEECELDEIAIIGRICGIFKLT